jgi:hypothetical protein
MYTILIELYSVDWNSMEFQGLQALQAAWDFRPPGRLGFQTPGRLAGSPGAWDFNPPGAWVSGRLDLTRPLGLPSLLLELQVEYRISYIEYRLYRVNRVIVSASAAWLG